MSNNEHQSTQPTAEMPIDLMAENIVRGSDDFAEHARMRRTNMVRGVIDTVKTIFKEGLIITMSSAEDHELVEMESYRQSLIGNVEETTAP